MKRDQLIKEMVKLRGEPPLSKEALKRTRQHIESTYLDSLMDGREPFDTGGPHHDGEEKYN